MNLRKSLLLRSLPFGNRLRDFRRFNALCNSDEELTPAEKAELLTFPDKPRQTSKSDDLS
jgi:hypothetical protein